MMTSCYMSPPSKKTLNSAMSFLTVRFLISFSTWMTSVLDAAENSSSSLPIHFPPPSLSLLSLFFSPFCSSFSPSSSSLYLPSHLSSLFHFLSPSFYVTSLWIYPVEFSTISSVFQLGKTLGFADMDVWILPSNLQNCIRWHTFTWNYKISQNLLSAPTLELVINYGVVAF